MAPIVTQIYLNVMLYVHCVSCLYFHCDMNLVLGNWYVFTDSVSQQKCVGKKMQFGSQYSLLVAVVLYMLENAV
jgi:hypothetical protein